MQAIHIDADSWNEIFEELPLSVKRKIEKAISRKPKAPIELVEAFVEQYEDENRIDQLIAIFAQELIGRCGQTLYKNMKGRKSMGGEKAVRLCVSELREMCDNYEEQYKEEDDEDEE